MTAEATILSEIKKLKEIVASIRQQTKQDEKWVSAFWIQQLTGWDGKMLEKARKQNLVKYKKNENGGTVYLLSSVPEEFKKKTA